MADRRAQALSEAEVAAGRAICPLFGRCGGCSNLHVTDAAYVAAKVARVVDAFASRGLAPPLDPLRRSPLASRRRATFTAVADGAGLRIGYRAARSHEVVDVAACPALAPSLAAALPAIREIAAEAAGSAGRARLLATLCHNGIDISVGFDRPPVRRGRGRRKPPPLPPLATADERVIRLTANGETVFQREPPVVRFDAVDIPFPAGAFLQPSREGEAALQELVLAAAAGAKTALDAFCGLGTFAIPLTRSAAVTAVEVDGAALTALSAGHAHATGRRGLTTLKRNLMGHPLSPQELEGFDVAVFDPPRAGAEGLATALAASAVPRVVAVSCEPSTLARDCAILAAGGYTITQATPVDQFVGTDHIEMVATLERNA